MRIVWGLLLLIGPQSLAGQRLVEGTVVDSTGRPVALVLVTSSTERLMTGSDGEFVIRIGPDRAISFRRVGYAPVDAVVPAVLDGRLDDIVMTPIPIRLDDIRVEALEPILTQRGVREFEFARREGVSRTFFTAYDIERLRPFDVSAISHRVAATRVVEDPNWGTVVQFLGRGGQWRTAAVRIDGVVTRNPAIDLFLRPEQIGAMWFDRNNGTVDIWTKPELIGRASPFSMGLRLGVSPREPGGLETLGGNLIVPVWGPVELYPAFDVHVGTRRIRWQAMGSVRSRLPFARSAYAGAGVLFRKYGVFDPVEAEAVPAALVGWQQGVGPLVFSGELVVSGRSGTQRITDLVVGVALALN